MAKIKAKKIGSMAAFKKSVKKGGGGGYLTRTPSDGSITVRFLTEPDGWVEYFEHFNDTRKFFPCSDDCEGCDAGEKPSKRYLTNAVDVQENKVVPLVLPASAASNLDKKYNKYSTLMDRDYEISRSGAGFDTEYDVTPEPPTKMNLKRFDALDLWALLEDQLEGDDLTTDDEEDEKPKSRKASASKGRRSAARDEDEDDDIFADDDEDDDEEDEDEPPARPRKTVAKKAPAKKVGVRKSSAPAKSAGKKVIRKKSR